MPNAEVYHKNKEKLKKQEADRYVRDRERILARNKAWNSANPESIKQSGDKYNEAHPERRLEIGRKSQKNRKQRNYESVMLGQAKGRAKRAGLEFNIDITDIIIPEFCPVFSSIALCKTNAKSFHNSPSLDRLIPSLGYVKGNVRVISHKANAMKQNATWQEIMKLAEWVKSEVERSPL